MKQAVTPSVQYVEIDASREGQRLDNYLFGLLKNVPKSRVYRMLRSGEVRVNKRRAKQTTRLAEGDIVRIPPVRYSLPTQTAQLGKGMRDTLASAVIYEDADVLMLNKPAGLPVHGGSGVALGLVEALRVLKPEYSKLELVHRLDKDTSGCLLLAKRRSALVPLQAQFRERTVEKRYVCLVHGQWPKHLRHINAPLLRDELPSGERFVRVAEAGKAASTDFKILQRFDDYTLIEAHPKTGRTHQIRVHCLHSGHPIAGDTKYCSDEQVNQSGHSGVHRLFLHSKLLALQLGSERQEWRSELDGSLIKILDKIGK